MSVINCGLNILGFPDSIGINEQGIERQALPRRAFPQPGTVPARLQSPRPRPGGRCRRAAARAPALPLHRLQQPRRILRDPRRRPEGADQARCRRPQPRRPGAARGFPPRSRPGPRPRRRAVRAAQRRHAAGPRQAGYPLPAPQLLERGAGGLDQGLLLPRGDAGADADRPRPGASLPARAQQEPQLRRRARGPGRLRPQLRRRHRAGAAGAAARHPAARTDRRRAARLRLPLLRAARPRRRAVFPA